MNLVDLLKSDSAQSALGAAKTATLNSLAEAPTGDNNFLSWISRGADIYNKATVAKLTPPNSSDKTAAAPAVTASGWDWKKIGLAGGAVLLVAFLIFRR